MKPAVYGKIFMVAVKHICTVGEDACDSFTSRSWASKCLHPHGEAYEKFLQAFK